MENTTRNNKSRMKLGYNEIMIVSMYFNDIKDFINLEIGIKRFQGNMERFHFNPIPLNEHSRKLFPNIETFHIYNKYDEIFHDGKINKQITWYEVYYSRYLKEKEAGNICKNIEFTGPYRGTIPPEVKSLGAECFSNYKDLTAFSIPTTIKKLGVGCFNRCVSLVSIEIPITVSKIGNGCFSGCTSLGSINIPSTIQEIGHWCFNECYSLKSINVENIKYISKERIFMNEPILNSIEIPRNLETVNRKNIEKRCINEFIIPTTITKLGDYCFEDCTTLTSISIPTTISEIGEYCFYGCTSLTRIEIPTTISEIGKGCFDGCSDQLKKNKSLKKLYYQKYYPSSDCFIV
ncbi:hypothetical protein, conserved [Entamoeba dispar SAW760]|uniref:Leucine rich repeat containing protein BspA family protein n=1 Tax=Entamoeba dispar (strain ATCC PRA-260 / SAW760) TaxID=370354 RepID=B0EHL3_ENTDS|nr:uncharacterized protein EDI_168030 [Entamoeba dispar SAW760]EDR25976.1 hypothetical protein, conserved [Entamoeba dispar SAW760]|eukprot:EDR25976.1 hypothetical protein, conserved [Entamoeba dispar SAW760]